ncbi:hypothetical protein CpipJ_CPIJ010767 [Culex quinquefasciatus]|uniref:Uncharacterized protein n=1 Tax=Culex quinquefasciatus TaxID=7176 RepID=B0WV93_CULQU|nr:hypothetical protein CpipJ_CPIJ010767 [Culex quinquefasciatus]|eukprot:XP_001861315.1 hypothetical protein CpipJ_CPIJ010767 [Culex quinquefasciatus]
MLEVSHMDTDIAERHFRRSDMTPLPTITRAIFQRRQAQTTLSRVAFRSLCLSPPLPPCSGELCTHRQLHMVPIVTTPAPQVLFLADGFVDSLSTGRLQVSGIGHSQPNGFHLFSNGNSPFRGQGVQSAGLLAMQAGTVERAVGPTVDSKRSSKILLRRVDDVLTRLATAAST